MLPEGVLDPVEAGEIPGPEGLHPDDTWPTPSGITLEMATASCVTPIQSLSVYNTCAEYTQQTMQFIITSCTLDILVRWPLCYHQSTLTLHTTTCKLYLWPEKSFSFLLKLEAIQSALCGWSRDTYNESQTANGRHIENLKKITIFPQHRHLRRYIA